MPQMPVSFIQALLDRGQPIQPTIAGSSSRPALVRRQGSFDASVGAIGLRRTSPAGQASLTPTNALANFPKLLQSLQGAQGTTVSASATAYDGMFQAAAARHQLDPSLLKAVARTESNFNPNAVSPAGAKGLMQIMDFNLKSLGVLNPFDPAQSIEGGAQMLRRLLDKYGGDASKALAAYNAGSGAVDRYGGIPPFAETQTYVKRVLDVLDGYQASAASSPLSAVLGR